MQLQLRWKLVRRRREIDAGTGRTIDMSSGGILFETGSELPTGLNVEIHIAWPMLLHEVAPLQLVVMGRIVRSSRGWAAIRTISHEFRTVGTIANQRQTLPNSSRSGHADAKAQRQCHIWRALGQLKDFPFKRAKDDALGGPSLERPSLDSAPPHRARGHVCAAHRLA